ncbi:cbb3-type cytochrome c oxidase subunit 3 [Chrysiogenes arsenatis]|nr:cbb3-type cytochrome c oxidase subunit 3 [Chrysiogenes arsenatis]
METGTLWYLLFGIALVVVLIVITIHTYQKKHRDHIEEPKYRMMQDGDE